MKLRITDFQAIEDIELDSHGITFITGLNNQGKSSIVRAFHALVAGRSGGDHVRYGQKVAMVGAELPEDPDNPPVQLAWIKGAEGAEYYIDGEGFDRLGRRGVPLEDLKKHGLMEVEFSGGRSHLNFALQKETEFLVSLPPTQVFDYVSKILQERKILPVIRVIAEDIKKIREEAVLLEGEIQTRKGSLKSWEEEKQALQPMLDRGDDFQELFQALSSMREMVGTRDRALSLESEMRALSPQVEEKREILARTEPLIQDLNQAVLNLDTMRSIQKSSRQIEQSLEEASQQLSALPVLEGVGGRIREAEEALSELEAMRVTRMQLQMAQGRVDRGEKDIQAAEREVASAEEEFENLKNEIGICPTCGSQIGGCNGNDVE